jgi:DNA-binding response OmpR family regulator
MSQGAGPVYKVLIVDDNPHLLSIITDSLLELGNFTVMTAADGAEGLACFYAERPDCVVIDVRMPHLNGYQLVKALRGDPDTAGTPLIILTAMAQDMDRFAGMAAGVDHYFVKPVKPQDLVAGIQHAITLSEADRRRRLQALIDEAPPQE